MLVFIDLCVFCTAYVCLHGKFARTLCVWLTGGGGERTRLGFRHIVYDRSQIYFSEHHEIVESDPDLFPAFQCSTEKTLRIKSSLRPMDSPLHSHKVCQFYSRLRCACNRVITWKGWAERKLGKNLTYEQIYCLPLERAYFKPHICGQRSLVGFILI